MMIPERGLRQLATGRQSRELAGDDCEIAFEQGKIGARLIGLPRGCATSAAYEQFVAPKRTKR
jgi:hypothetical protein